MCSPRDSVNFNAEDAYTEMMAASSGKLHVPDNTYATVKSIRAGLFNVNPEKKEEAKTRNVMSVAATIILIVTIVGLVGIICACIALGTEIAKLKSKTDSLDSFHPIINNLLDRVVVEESSFQQTLSALVQVLQDSQQGQCLHAKL